MKKRLALVAAVMAAVLLVAGCDRNKSANSRDQDTAARQLAELSTNQPVPVFSYSQLRQNLVEIETAQAQGAQTTTFFFNMGVGDPIMSCPSIGFPIPTTDQLTNPEQAHTAWHNPYTLHQIEANGVYTGDSTGTYVLCVNAQGQPYANYWEGFVNTVAGPAKWDTGSHSVQLLGPPSFQFSKGKK